MKKVINKYISAVRWMFGFNRKDAVNYIKSADPALLRVILAGYMDQCGRAFVND